MTVSFVNIIIVNYKNWQDTKECLSSVLSSRYKQYRVFIVDNNSQNNSLELISEWLLQKGESFTRISTDDLNQNRLLTALSSVAAGQDRIVLIQNIANTGFAAANNLVIEKLVGNEDYIWLLNPDMVVEPDTLDHLVRCAEQQSRRSIIGATIKQYVRPHRLLFYGGGRINFSMATVVMATRTEDISRLDYISGGCMFTAIGSFKELGLLPEDYFLYWEETDWCYRAKRQGFEIHVCEEAVCFDKISTIIGRSFLADYYYVRNGLIFVSKFKPSRLWTALWSSRIRLLKRMISGQFRRASGVHHGVKDFQKLKRNEG